ncbi:MAG: AAA family ATPase [Egibacteraceae bacterium]
MAAFYGRSQEIARLTADLEQVRATGEGRFVVVRGRRQVGKSRLVEEFPTHHDVPSVYFQATIGAARSARAGGVCVAGRAVRARCGLGRRGWRAFRHLGRRARGDRRRRGAGRSGGRRARRGALPDRGGPVR